MKKLPLFLIIFVVSINFAQTKMFEISGVVISQDDGQPLESATIHLEQLRDSSIVNYTIADKYGKFLLEDKTNQSKLNLYISFSGYKSHFKVIDLKESKINLDTIRLKFNTNLLDEVVIQSKPPIIIKKDTLEFNVSSFKTKKDANVEDLLKKLPSVEVDEKGNIKINGKEVDKILVNGKPFFGDSPTVTTQNLTKSIIEKIQITDTKTKSEAFTGEDGKKTNKTINLIIKKENNKGKFGHLYAAKGTEAITKGSGMINIFNNDRRVSFIANQNYINVPKLNKLEINAIAERPTIYNEKLRKEKGLNTNGSFATNYSDKLTKDVNISSSYNRSHNHRENQNSKKRENILPDSKYFSNTSSNSLNESSSHNANFSLDIKIDSTILINIRPNFNFRNSFSQSSNYEQTKNETGELTNESNRTSFSENAGYNFNNNLTFTKKLKIKGSFLKFHINNSFNENQSETHLNSTTTIFSNDPTNTSRNQFTDNDNNTQNIKATTSYRIPIKADILFLDINYSISNNKQEKTNSTYNFNNLDQDYTDFNKELSTDSKYLDRRNTTGINLSFRKKKLNTNLGIKHGLRTLDNNDFLRPELNLTRKFKALEVQSNLRYNISRYSSFSARYNSRKSPPQLSQLQAFKNITNPLNTIVGNPNLKSTNAHNFNFSFNRFNFQKKNGFYVYANGSFSKNQVVSKSTIDENFIRNTTYTNVNGNYNLNISANYNKTIKIDSLKSLKLNIRLSTGQVKSINFNNDIQYASKNNSITPGLGFTFHWLNVLDINPYYNLRFNTTKFDINNLKDQTFMSHSLSINTQTFVPKNLEWRNSFNYRYNPNISNEFQKSAWNWDATFSYFLFKDKGIVSLNLYDILNKNNNTTRSATQNYIQDSVTNVLNQYFMLGFKWKFNNRSKAKKRSSSMFSVF